VSLKSGDLAVVTNGGKAGEVVLVMRAVSGERKFSYHVNFNLNYDLEGYWHDGIHIAAGKRFGHWYDADELRPWSGLVEVFKNV